MKLIILHSPASFPLLFEHLPVCSVCLQTISNKTFNTTQRQCTAVFQKAYQVNIILVFFGDGTNYRAKVHRSLWRDFDIVGDAVGKPCSHSSVAFNRFIKHSWGDVQFVGDLAQPSAKLLFFFSHSRYLQS